MPDLKYRSLLTFLGAAAGGACLSLMIGLVLFYLRAEEMFGPSLISTSLTPDASQDSIPSPASTQITVLNEAEEALQAGQPEKVQGLLYPMIESWTSNEDRIRGYRLLGEAELAQGHAQLAVPYYEKLYFYQPTPQNLYILATVYDMGGDIRRALAKYQELANWEDLPPEIDREYLHFRIDDISRSLGTPVPTYTPLP